MNDNSVEEALDIKILILFYAIALIIGFIIGIIIDWTMIYPKFKISSSTIGQNITTNIINDPPTIKKVEILNVTTSSATIKWLTEENTTGRVTYCRPNSTCGASDIDTVLKTEHEIIISDLLPDTTYELTLTCIDAKQNQIDFKLDNCLTTKPEKDTNISLPAGKDTTGPAISLPAENAKIRTITWETDKKSKCQLIFWSDSFGPYTLTSSENDTRHSVIIPLANIAPNKENYYLIIASDSSGNSTTSEILKYNGK